MISLLRAMDIAGLYKKIFDKVKNLYSLVSLIILPFLCRVFIVLESLMLQFMMDLGLNGDHTLIIPLKPHHKIQYS